MKLGDWTFRAVHDGRFKLDGGAMFGVVPKVFWQKQHPADELNRIDLDLRCLLADASGGAGSRRILVDTGMGDRWDEKKVGVFGLVRRPNQLVAELAEEGVTRESVTDVILTHLHFDHAGGAVREVDGRLVPTFPEARYWVQRRHWEWAGSPSERDRASFRPEDFSILQAEGRLELIDGAKEIIPGVRVTPISGHTPGQQMVEFHTGAGVLVFCADLLPYLEPGARALDHGLRPEPPADRDREEAVPDPRRGGRLRPGLRARHRARGRHRAFRGRPLRAG